MVLWVMVDDGQADDGYVDDGDEDDVDGDVVDDCNDVGDDDGDDDDEDYRSRTLPSQQRSSSVTT